MQPVAGVLSARATVGTLAPLTFVAGVGGMAVSFLFLASSHPLDVMAGAAGFVAGAVLVAAGLVSIALQIPAALVDGQADDVAALEPPLDVARWAAHFRGNREHRPEPEWTAPVTLPQA